MTPDELREALALLNRAVEYADAAALSFADRALDARNGHTAEIPHEMDESCAQAADDGIELRGLADKLTLDFSQVWQAGVSAAVAIVLDEAERLKVAADDIQYAPVQEHPVAQKERFFAVRGLRREALRIAELASRICVLGISQGGAINGNR